MTLFRIHYAHTSKIKRVPKYVLMRVITAKPKCVCVHLRVCVLAMFMGSSETEECVCKY